MTSQNPRWPTTRRKAAIALLSTALIFSHLATANASAHRCYMCGPAAAQVHRSSQPPSCDPLLPSLVAKCDKSHPYCATIATTNPYSESRTCSRHLQEDCRYVHCERTNTSKMTCTCQGELCNGEKDQRVAEAFRELGDRKPSTATVEVATTEKLVATSVQLDEGGGKEFHNALEIDTPWPMSSETETVERLPKPGALRDNGGGEDDEDSAEGSGAVARADTPTPPPSPAPPHTPPTSTNNTAPALTPVATTLAAAIFLFT